MLDSNENLKQHAIPNSGLQNLKICSSKGYRKTSQKRIMYVANTGILKHRFSAKDITSNYGFLLRLMNTFTNETEKYPLPNVHDAKTFKNLVVSFYALFSQIICINIADWLIQLGS